MPQKRIIQSPSFAISLVGPGVEGGLCVFAGCEGPTLDVVLKPEPPGSHGAIPSCPGVV